MAGKVLPKETGTRRVVGLGVVLIALLLAAITLECALGAARVQNRWRIERGSFASPPLKRMLHRNPPCSSRKRRNLNRNRRRFPQEPEPEPEPEASRVTLMALGDNLIHNTVYWSAELPAGGYDFAPFYEAIAPVVSQYDIACINQETILVGDPALYANYPNFGSPTQVADALAKTGFSVVTGATNHCFDKGETGILDTCRYWREHYPDITTLGIHDSEEDAKTLRVIEKKRHPYRDAELHLRSQWRRAGKGVDG